MESVPYLLRFVLATVFFVAGVAKLRDPIGAQATVGGVGVPARWRGTVAFVLSATELGVGVLVLLPGFGVIGAAMATALLAVFLIALGVQFARGVEVPCACFGQVMVTPAGWPTLARNVVLLGLAVAALISAH